MSLAVVLLCRLACAQGTLLSDFQVWNEIDVSARLGSHSDLSWVNQGRFSTQYPNPQTYLTGVDWKIAMGRGFEFTPSYYHLAAESVTGSSAHFQLPMLSVSARGRWKRTTFADRNRFLGALRKNDNFWIYVNRPRIDREIGCGRWGSSAFVWDELFYFSPFHAWTRNRAAAGLRKEFSDYVAADVYFLRQDDSRVQPRAIVGIGTNLEWRIR